MSIRNSETIEGLDLKSALDQFDGDRESLKEVLTVYVDQASHMLEQIRTFTEEKIADYIIAIHGIKGSSKGVFAEEVGNLAESLEYAAKAENIKFIEENNKPLIETIEKLIMSIKDWLI